MTVWGNILDRGAGEISRKEDMQKTINDLTEELEQLKEKNKKLLERLNDFRKYKDFFHEPSPAIWYADWNNKDEEKGIKIIF